MLVIVGMMTFGFRAVVLNLLEFMESHCFFKSSWGPLGRFWRSPDWELLL